MGTLLEPFRYEFFRDGVIVATLAGALCGLVGVFIVLRGMSYLGHGLSHAVFGGFAVASLVGWSYLFGAGAWGLVTALAVATVSRRRSLGADAVIGVITTASFAFGLVLADVFRGPRQSFDAALFGSILGVDAADVWGLVAVTLVAAVVIFVGYRPLLFTTFDPEVARASGVQVGWVDAVLMFVLATAIIATMQVVGATLLVAMLVIPATVARLLTHRFSRMLWISLVVGATSGFVGMNLSYHLDWKSGPTIVLVGSAAFAVALLVGGRGRLRRLAPLGHVG